MTDINYTKTIVCIGTGPSLTMRQVDVARQKGFELWGCNRTFLDIPDLAGLYGCNLQFWDAYHQTMIAQQFAGKCMSSNWEASQKYPWIEYFAPVNKDGMATPTFGTKYHTIHHGHSTGYQLLGAAYLAGATRIVLLGYDMKFADDYDGRNERVGSTPRHYFGEYPEGYDLVHFPSVSVDDRGVHTELCRLYGTIAKQGLVEVVNCSADSALVCFPRMPIEEVDGEENTLRYLS